MIWPFSSRRRASSPFGETPSEQRLFVRFTSFIRPQSFQIGLGLFLTQNGSSPFHAPIPDLKKNSTWSGTTSRNAQIAT